ncbi:hypothetical protein SAMN05216369_3005 [Marinobacter antarcticus]|uniref:Uncharacterized protein n=1 Tax=Marinobacter antarcticus TaxID=564117 RepID=A0A1M6UZF2_9GAMM|nr:hypothetical protein SAMN05216369_3005 [Marinobacter antarcticus]
MLEHGSNNSLPAKYRIALALSIAFMIHTLLLSGTHSLIPAPPVTHRQQLNLELVASASTPETPASAHTPVSGEKSGSNQLSNTLKSRKRAVNVRFPHSGISQTNL